MIVLDTHAWFYWWADSGQLSSAARVAIETADAIGIPAVCCCELAQLVQRKRIEIDRDVLPWIEHTLAIPRVALLPLSPAIAVGAVRLLWPYRDPADRIIVATAVVHRAPLVTKDARIRRFQGVQTIW